MTLSKTLMTEWRKIPMRLKPSVFASNIFPATPITSPI
jgi:hypothetical protein